VLQSEEERQHLSKDLMHIAYRFDPARSFWDISNPELNTYLHTEFLMNDALTVNTNGGSISFSCIK
jgi:hypothetical protein